MCNSKIGRKLLISLKATAGMPGPNVLISVGFPPKAFLRPIATKQTFLSQEDVRSLTNWRNRFVHSFLTEFKATYERTARWLVEVVGINEGKILFMADDLNGHTFGYMGLDHINWEKAIGEADAVVRGAEAPSGIMKHALQTLLSWGQGQLGLRKLGVRVRSDNTALGFYQKVGYREIRRIPLRRVEEPKMVRWVEDKTIENAKIHLVHMIWQGLSPNQ